jgi:hypothetical protein
MHSVNCNAGKRRNLPGRDEDVRLLGALSPQFLLHFFCFFLVFLTSFSIGLSVFSLVLSVPSMLFFFSVFSCDLSWSCVLCLYVFWFPSLSLCVHLSGFLLVSFWFFCSSSFFSPPFFRVFGSFGTWPFSGFYKARECHAVVAW